MLRLAVLALSLVACGGTMPASTDMKGAPSPDLAEASQGPGPTRDGGESTPDGATAPTATGLRVDNGTNGSSGHIVDAEGKTVSLHGVNRSGTEFACVNGGFADGPVDQGDVDAMKAWNVDAVRVPLNEDCWLGINGLGGASYRSAVLAWVTLLTTNKLRVIVDLHWVAAGTQQAVDQRPMADADHAPAFWTSVATAFAGNGDVIFDLFNEPYVGDWTCWAKGGTCADDRNGAAYEVAGMASLLKAVRDTGASNVVILGGLSYSGDLSQWVKTVATFPSVNGVSLANIAASVHMYDFNSVYTGCPSQFNSYSATCYGASQTAANQGMASVLAAGYPLVVGESGISAFASSTPFSSSQLTELEAWYDGMLSFFDTDGQSYFAWSWNTDTPPLLVTDYDGAPTPGFGVTFKQHLAQF